MRNIKPSLRQQYTPQHYPLAGGRPRTAQSRPVQQRRAQTPGNSCGVRSLLSGCNSRIVHALHGSHAGATPEQVTSRIWALCLLFLLLGGGVSAMLASLQLSSSSPWRERSARAQAGKVTVEGARGRILDVSGRVLALSGPSLSIGLHPKELSDPSEAVSALTHVMAVHYGQSLTHTAQRLTEAVHDPRPFVWLARGLPVELEETLRAQVPQGLVFFKEFRRVYPHGEMLGAVLGRVGDEGQGMSGLEFLYEPVLKASSHTKQVVRDARRRWVPVSESPTLSNPSVGLYKASFGKLGDTLFFSEEDDQLPSVEVRDEGEDVTLTIDSDIQSIVEEEIRRTHTETGAEETFGVLIDADSHELIAVAQAPSFNPNSREAIAQKALKASAFQNAYEPGSVIKPIIAAIALDAGVVTPHEAMQCEKALRIGRHTIKDVHEVGSTDLRGVLVQSSNVCISKIAARLGPEKLREGLKAFGFGEVTGTGFPGEAKGILDTKGRWGAIEVATHSFGQGFTATPLQLARAYGVLAGRGRTMKLTMTRSTGAQETNTAGAVSAKAAETVLEMLRGVVEDEHGTAPQAKIPGLTVAGKTGTAHQPLHDGRGYSPDRVLSSFVGVVDPSAVGIHRRLVLYVGVLAPEVKPRWGGKLAAPAFRRIMERTTALLISRGDRLPQQRADRGQYM